MWVFGEDQTWKQRSPEAALFPDTLTRIFPIITHQAAATNYEIMVTNMQKRKSTKVFTLN
jgi:hypothetical protein